MLSVAMKAAQMMQEALEDLCWPNEGARFSGFQFALGVEGEVVSRGHGGAESSEEGSSHMAPRTLFDLASVTKLFTASLASVLHAAGEIDLDSSLGSWCDLQEPMAGLTTRQLLTHTSGLPPWWEEQSTRNSTIQVLKGLMPDDEQKGEIVYSCTGYSLFAVCLEEKFGQGFNELVGERLLEPLGLDAITFNPEETSAIAIAKEPAEEIARGKVHDPRARAMDGVSGNAGLFGNAEDVARFFMEVINPSSKIFNNVARKELFTPTVSGEWDQAIGFRHKDNARLGAAAGFFSHSGFTGTLAMVDPESQTVGVLLTNRLQCESSREEMGEVYRMFAEWVGEKNG